MSLKDRLRFKPLEETDIDELTEIMKDSFNYDSKIHLGTEGGPPGYDDGSFIRRWGLDNGSDAYKVLLEDKTVGMVILWINKETNENFLGAIFVDASEQDKGLGKEIWESVEEMYPETKIWRTETPGFSRRNHYFYVNKCGFKIVKIANHKDENESSYMLEKIMK